MLAQQAFPLLSPPRPIVCQRYVLNDAQVSETFDLLDVDGDGRLNRSEIAALLRTAKVEPTRIELDFIFSEMDSEKSGLINKEEFVRYMRSPPPQQRSTADDMRDQFNSYDSDGDGAITYDELRKMLAECAHLHDDDLVREMFDTADQARAGRITFDSFIKLMQD